MFAGGYVMSSRRPRSRRQREATNRRGGRETGRPRPPGPASASGGIETTMRNGYGCGKGRGMGQGMGRGRGGGGGRGRGLGMRQGPGGGRGMGRWQEPALAPIVRDVARRLEQVARESTRSDASGTPPAARLAPLPAEAHDKGQQRAKSTAIIDRDRCTGCGVCVNFCPERAISVNDIATIAATGCTGCGECVAVCPNAAISLSDEARCAAG
jgi:NAD-dependent dihydropyrimidine dehydrogenase PreA subunit